MPLDLRSLGCCPCSLCRAHVLSSMGEKSGPVRVPCVSVLQKTLYPFLWGNMENIGNP